MVKGTLILGLFRERLSLKFFSGSFIQTEITQPDDLPNTGNQNLWEISQATQDDWLKESFCSRGTFFFLNPDITLCFSLVFFSICQPVL